jgi:hypothetical protein
MAKKAKQIRDNKVNARLEQSSDSSRQEYLTQELSEEQDRYKKEIKKQMKLDKAEFMKANPQLKAKDPITNSIAERIGKDENMSKIVAKAGNGTPIVYPKYDFKIVGRKMPDLTKRKRAKG